MCVHNPKASFWFSPFPASPQYVNDLMGFRPSRTGIIPCLSLMSLQDWTKLNRTELSRGRGFAPRNGEWFSIPQGSSVKAFTRADKSSCPHRLPSPLVYLLCCSVYLFRHLRISPHQGRKLTMNVFQFFLARYLNINP